MLSSKTLCSVCSKNGCAALQCLMLYFLSNYQNCILLSLHSALLLTAELSAVMRWLHLTSVAGDKLFDISARWHWHKLQTLPFCCRLENSQSRSGSTLLHFECVVPGCVATVTVAVDATGKEGQQRKLKVVWNHWRTKGLSPGLVVLQCTLGVQIETTHYATHTNEWDAC